MLEQARPIGSFTGPPERRETGKRSAAVTQDQLGHGSLVEAGLHEARASTPRVTAQVICVCENGFGPAPVDIVGICRGVDGALCSPGAGISAQDVSVQREGGLDAPRTRPGSSGTKRISDVRAL